MTGLRIAALVALAAWQQTPVFRAELRLVVLHATVRGPSGELVTGLSRDAFTVTEDGRPQPIDIFRADDVPVSLGLVIDNSASMRTKRSRVEAAALALARASNPDDELCAVNFSDKAHLDVPLTTDLWKLAANISRLDSFGGTAMRDAVAMAQAYLADRGTRDRRVLVVITDGHDNASDASLALIRATAQQQDVTVYAIGLLAPDDPQAKAAHRDLDDLAMATGGIAVYPTTLDEVDRAALDLAHQIRTQYTIAYAPARQELDGSYRTIRVEARGDRRLTVRTRQGYVASPDAR